MINYPIGLKELKLIIKSFLQTPYEMDTFRFEEPLRLKEDDFIDLIDMLKVFGKIYVKETRRSYNDMWTELWYFDRVIFAIDYREPETGTYVIYEITLTRRNENITENKGND